MPVCFAAARPCPALRAGRRDRAAGGARRLGRSALRRRTDVGRHLVGDNGRFGKTGSGLSDSGPVRLLRHTTERLFLRTIGQAGGLPCADANE